MPTPPVAGTQTFTDGQVPTAADWAKAFGSDAWWLGGGSVANPRRPSFHLESHLMNGSATQAISANTFTTLTSIWGASTAAAPYDTDQAFNPATGAYTIPVAGIWMFSFAVAWSPLASGNRWVFGDPDPTGDGNSVRTVGSGSNNAGDTEGKLSVIWTKRCTASQAITPQVYTTVAASVEGALFSGILISL